MFWRCPLQRIFVLIWKQKYPSGTSTYVIEFRARVESVESSETPTKAIWDKRMSALDKLLLCKPNWLWFIASFIIAYISPPKQINKENTATLQDWLSGRYFHRRKNDRYKLFAEKTAIATKIISRRFLPKRKYFHTAKSSSINIHNLVTKSIKQRFSSFSRLQLLAALQNSLSQML